MRFPRSIDVSTIGILLTVALATAMGIGPARTQIASFSVGSDNSTTLNPAGQLTTFPDEHVTFMPQTGGGYLVFGSSGGAVELQTQDLVTFNFVNRVMSAPLGFTSCNPNPADNTEFDENYVGPGTVVQDPTLPAGNLIMIYEAENHCPGGDPEFDYYATSGLARSSDNGNTWPMPIDNSLGGPNRYPALKSAMPEPTTSSNDTNIGDAIPTAFVDVKGKSKYLYILYENASETGIILRIARANLITDNVAGTLQFHKWYNGSFSQPGIGGLDTPLLPSTACSNGRQGSLAHDDDLGVYVMIFLCIHGTSASWYYSTTTSLDTEVWTTPQQIMGSSMPWLSPCPGRQLGQGTEFDGFYPSIMSRGLPVGHIHNTGSIYFLGGCDGGASDRHFRYREFTITGAEPSPVGGPGPPVGGPSPPTPESGTMFMQVGTLPVPGLTSFDMSYVNSTIHGGTMPDGLYSLADRSNKLIDTWQFALAPPLYFGQTANFVGAVAVNGAVNNDLSGPNGQLTFANPTSGHFEIWAGDGPQLNIGCPAFMNESCSTVKVMDYFRAGAAHVIATHGAARAGKLCHDPTDHLVMVANDAEYDFKFGTPFVSWISTETYQIVAQMLIPEATNGVEQCQYDSTTGFFFLNLPEGNGPGNNTADGDVLVITPPTSSNQFTPTVVATYVIPTVDCAGPQGMAIGPEPQLLLGCNAVGPNGVQNSLIINKHNGAVLAIGWGVGGADEVWANPGDGHYYITGSSLPSPQLAVVDAQGSAGCGCTGPVDQLIPTPTIDGVSAHSVAGSIGTYMDGVGGSWNQVIVVPTGGGINIFAPFSTVPDSDSDDIPYPAQVQ